MPNVKFFVDASQCPAAREAIAGLLPALREMLCDSLGVERADCQFAVIEVAGLGDQPPINAELAFLPKPSRTPEALRAAALRLRAEVGAATGLHVAVRMASLDPATYIALK